MKRNNHDLVLDPWLERLQLAKRAIEEAETIVELKDISDVAVAGHAFARAKKSREMANLANEVRLRAERKAGILLLAIPRSKGNRKGLTVTYKELGIDDNAGASWQRLARVQEDLFEEILCELKAANRDLSVGAVMYHVTEMGSVPLESGIVRLRDGRLRIFWSDPGNQPTTQSRTLSAGSTLTRARAERSRALKRVRESRKQRLARGELDEAYSLVRRSLSSLDLVLDKIDSGQRQRVERAMAALHKAEDEITLAIKSRK